MNRELKFRAWNTDYANPIMEYFVWNDLKKIERLQDKVIMQFTRLHDKKGKEIYEGDIFCVSNNKKYQIRYCSQGESSYEWCGACFILWCDDQMFFPFDEYAIKNGEVIGNIYENPELC